MVTSRPCWWTCWPRSVLVWMFDLLLVEGGLGVLDRLLEDDGQVGSAALVVAGVFSGEWLIPPRRGQLGGSLGDGVVNLATGLVWLKRAAGWG